MRALRIGVIAVAILIGGCSPSMQTASPDEVGEKCWVFDGDGRVESLAWSSDGQDLFALHSPGAGGWQLSRIDVDGADSIETHSLPDALGPLTVDGEGRPMWIASTVDGPARIDQDVDGAVQTIGDLPHPRITRIFWTNDALAGIEWGGSNDAFRLVRLNVADQFVDISPLTQFDSKLVDAAISTDGSTQVMSIREGDGPSHLTVVSGSRTTRMLTDQPVTGVDTWVARDTVVYRGEVDGIPRAWTVGDNSERAVLASSVYVNRLSTSGRLAYAKVTEDGPQHGVCVIQL